VFSNIFAEDTIANSKHNGLQISVERILAAGLLFQASYTFSKAIDQGASFENELNPLNFNATRGLSLVDARNRFVFSPLLPAPDSQTKRTRGQIRKRLGCVCDYYVPECLPDMCANAGWSRSEEQLLL